MSKIKPTRILTIAIVVVLIGFIGWKLLANKKVVDERNTATGEVSFAIPVNTTKVVRDNLARSISLTGEFQAEESVSLIAETQGSVEALLMEEGDVVSKGQVLMKIDDASLQSQLKFAEASLEKAKKDHARYVKLVESGAVSQQSIEEKALNVKTSESNLESIKQQLRFTSVKSPIRGVINTVNVEDGEFVMAGTQVAEVINIDQLKFTLYVSEGDLWMLKEGGEYEIKTKAYPLDSFKGRVDQISYKSNDAKKYKVTMLVKNNSEKPLRIGMYGLVEISQKEDNEAKLTLPQSAIVGSLKDPVVYVIQGGKAHAQPVVIGSKISNQVVVLKGLKEGQEVVTSGQINLTEGAEVSVVNQ